MLKEILKERCVVFDIESNGLNLRYSLPFQLSWNIYENGTRVAQKDRYLHFDDFSIGDEAARINKFSWDKYRKRAEDPSAVAKEFFDDIKGSYVIGHNILNFDVFVLNTLRRRCGMKETYEFLDQCRDTRAFAIAIELNKKTIDRDILAWQYAMLSIRDRKLKSSQEYLLKKFGIDYDPELLHEACYDNDMCYKILNKMSYEFV